MTKCIFILKGLTCPACKKLTEKRIGTIADVTSVIVDLSSGQAEIISSRPIAIGEVNTVLRGTPYQAE
jgi:hypothetical protein